MDAQNNYKSITNNIYILNNVYVCAYVHLELQNSCYDTNNCSVSSNYGLVSMTILEKLIALQFGSTYTKNQP